MRFPNHPELSQLIATLVRVWPDHETFLARRFKDCDVSDLDLCETLAGIIMTLAGEGLEDYCHDYQWTCNLLMEEELYFCRTGSPRYTTFAEADKHVYSNDAVMGRYINGLFLSQLLWGNQTRVLKFFVDTFLTSSPAGGRLLEIGPGHGLSLYFAAGRPNLGPIEAWDISEASIAATRHILQKMNIEQSVTLRRIDLFQKTAEDTAFQDVVLSEVLEHLETPREALLKIRDIMAPGGRLFLNVPCNSPAPDHISLFDSPEAIFDLATTAGFVLEENRIYPTTGYSEERARKAKITMSCAAIARKPA